MGFFVCFAFFFFFYPIPPTLFPETREPLKFSRNLKFESCWGRDFLVSKESDRNLWPLPVIFCLLGSAFPTLGLGFLPHFYSFL